MTVFPIIRESAALKRTLRAAKARGVVAFDLASLGELQFFQPVLVRFAERNPDVEIVIVHHSDTAGKFKAALPSLANRLRHVSNTAARRVWFPEIDLFLATEQYSHGLVGVYSVALFHGQPSKGLTFDAAIVDSFDALFLYGPLHRETLEEFVREMLPGLPPHLELYEVGYPKSDALLNGCFPADKTRAALSLDASKKTLLYAPAFNEGASLREFGLDLIELLAAQAKYNVIVKLPIDCWQPTSNFYATGGVDWFERIRDLEARFPGLRLSHEYLIDPLLACADVLVTCVSSVGFEFMALNKPVVFVETPKFFSGFLQRRFPGRDTVSWAARTTVNGGREFGITVGDYRDVPAAVETVLAHPGDYPRQQERLKHYLLYNRGHATEAAVAKIEDLLARRVKSRRLGTKRGLCGTLLHDASRWPITHALSPALKGVARFAKEPLLRLLNARGLTLQKTGCGYLDAAQTVRAAAAAKLSICEYLERREPDARKRGRRDRICAAMRQRNLFAPSGSILEIGAGTGMYTEKCLELAHPRRYEVYETDHRWVEHLKRVFGAREGCAFVFQAADGASLQGTAGNSCDLVHAHAVFVYIPLLNTLSYLRDAARVLRPNGHLLFDCCLDSSFGLAEAEAWLASPWRFPVLLPESLLLEFAAKQGLDLTDRFREIYGPTFVDYLVFKKAPPRQLP